MNIDDLLQKFTALTEMRDKIQVTLGEKSEALRRASLAFIYEEYGQNEDVSLEQLLDVWQSDFHLSAKQAAELRDAVRAGQAASAAQLSQIYTDVGALTGPLKIDLASLQSAHMVDFPHIDSLVRNAVTNKLRRMIALGGGAEEFITDLRRSGLVRHQARTLGMTAIAQFDNAYTISIAEEAGIDRFVYHGPPAERAFCQIHLGQVYTTAQIRKMDNGQGLDVLTSAGGYNCRHMWVAVPDGMESTMEKDNERNQ